MAFCIVALSDRGHMPVSTPDQGYRITYNGEVYNYRELRDELEARGNRFRSNTDTEVVLALFANEGPSMLDRLNEMFVFAIWDSLERSLFLARDRVGIKPLFYHVDRDGILRFASEPKALFGASVVPEFDHSPGKSFSVFVLLRVRERPGTK